MTTVLGLTIVLGWATLKWFCLGSFVMMIIGFLNSEGMIETGWHGAWWGITKLCFWACIFSFAVLVIRGLII